MDDELEYARQYTFERFWHALEVTPEEHWKLPTPEWVKAEEARKEKERAERTPEELEEMIRAYKALPKLVPITQDQEQDRARKSLYSASLGLLALEAHEAAEYHQVSVQQINAWVFGTEQPPAHILMQLASLLMRQIEIVETAVDMQEPGEEPGPYPPNLSPFHRNEFGVDFYSPSMASAAGASFALMRLADRAVPRRLWMDQDDEGLPPD